MLLAFQPPLSINTLEIERKIVMAEQNEVVMLTTIDNPFDPFEQFNQWYLFDMEKGYNTCAYLARITDKNSDSEEVEEAIDEIIRNDFLNLYKKVTRKDSKNSSNEEGLKEETMATPGGS